MPYIILITTEAHPEANDCTAANGPFDTQKDAEAEVRAYNRVVRTTIGPNDSPPIFTILPLRAPLVVK
jgi:hypothetical protein